MANTLGIDIGTHAVKAVSIAGPRGADVRWSQVEERGDDPSSIGERLQRLHAAAVPPADMVVTALSGESVPVVFVELPFANRKLVERTVPFEIEEHLPSVPEDHELVFQVIESDRQHTRVVCALAPDTLIQTRLEEFSEAGIEPRIVDLDLLALYGCALRIPCREPVRALVDIGASKTLIVVLEGEKLISTRVLRMGSHDATEAIAAALSLGIDQAESMKLSFDRSAGLGHTVSPGDPVEARAVHKALSDCYRSLIQAISATLATQERREGRSIGRVMLAGGGARASGLAALASEELQTPTTLAPMPTDAQIDGAHWPEAAVAYGLALRGVRGAAGSAINFRTGDYAYGREVKEFARRVVPLAVPVALIVLALMVSVFARLIDRGGQLRALDARITETYQQAFPNEPIVDVDVQIAQHRATLARKIQLLRGPSSATQVLADLSSAIPASTEVTADEVLLEGNKLTLKGRTANYDRLSTVSESLRDHGAFDEVLVQEQEKTGSEVRFRITAIVGHDLEESP